jgi:hypothetical protein
MAILLNGIMGPVQGKVGTVVGSSWKGKAYIKGPYKRRTKNVSEKELANREKFGKAQAWLKPLLGFVRVGFKGFSQYSEGFVAAKSYLMKNAIEGDLSNGGIMKNIRINPALMKVSFGNLPLSKGITVSPSGPDKLEFAWDDSLKGEGHPRDQAMMLAYNVEKGEVNSITEGQLRMAGSDILFLPTGHKAGDTYHIYFAFNAADRSRQSDSVYLGTITV